MSTCLLGNAPFLNHKMAHPKFNVSLTDFRSENFSYFYQCKNVNWQFLSLPLKNLAHVFNVGLSYLNWLSGLNVYVQLSETFYFVVSSSLYTTDDDSVFIW